MPDDHSWLHAAVELSRNCPPTDSAFSVGAIVLDAQGHELGRGYSRESDERSHAEEAVLSKVDHDRLPGGTMYSSLEPCTSRKSRPRSCTQLIIDAGITRVVFALREPPVFTRCEGVARLEAAGITVVELPELAETVREINAAVLNP